MALLPYLAAGFFPARFVAWVRALPAAVRLALPSLLCIPYVLVMVDRGRFSVQWLILYAALPVAMAATMAFSGFLGKGRGYWLELLVLVVLDLRWFERAWPAHLSIFNKVLLLD